MARTEIHNASGAAYPLPPPLHGPLAAGQSVVSSYTVEQLRTLLGLDAYDTSIRLTTVPDTFQVTPGLEGPLDMLGEKVTGLGAPAAGDDAATKTYADGLIAGPATADADGLSQLAVIRQAFAAGGGGVPDDVVIYNANAPFGFRVLDAQVLVATTVLASTVQLRDATGGGGSALSDAFDSATAGRKRDTGVAGANATPTVAANGTLVLRRSDSGVAGELIVTLRRE